jgi:hypothetical protein
MLHVLFIYLMIVLFNAPAFAADVDDADDVFKTPVEIALVAAEPVAKSDGGGAKPLDQPVLEDPQVAAWAARVAAQVMTFSATNLDQRMAQSKDYFTPQGWDNFQAAVKSSRLVDKVRDEKDMITATTKLDPVVMQEGVENGVYRWIVKFPLALDFKNETAGKDTVWQLTLKIERMDGLNSVGIAQWIATPQ